MHSHSTLSSFFITTILLVFYHLKCEARDSINVGNPLKDSRETLISAGNRFELGFFTPQGNDKSHKRHVGIWYYKLTPRTIVWVANRDKPISGSCGVFGISEDGNLKIWCNKEVIFSIAVPKMSTFNRTLQLLDSGNLLLFDGNTTVWQSFDSPTDTFLPGMKMNDMELISWISPSDPGRGNFSFRIDQDVYRIQNRSTLYWKSGELGPRGIFLYNEKLPNVVAQIFSDNHTQSDQVGQLGQTYINYSSFSNVTRASYCNYSRLVMNSSGKIQYYCNSSLLWFEPRNFCSEYDACGKFGICNTTNKPMYCQCLQGFKPASSEDWKAGTYSDGCERETRHTKDDRFLNLKLMKIGGQATSFDQAQEEATCRNECLSRPKCEAYIYKADASKRETDNSVPKCYIWTDLKDLQIGYPDDELNLSLRVPFSYIVSANPSKGSGGSRNNSRTIYAIVLTVSLVGVVLVFCSSYVLHQRRRMVDGSGNQGSIEAIPMLSSYERERQVNEMLHETDKGIDIPSYNFNIILSATDNFSDANKLGRGGFGPVYKGKFPGGREIAVKRLSSCSSQGIDEFLNEVNLIAKLQHRNLVRLLGYCIKDNEKILLYEYMPNRSLDAIIFDHNACLLLDWKKRFYIILGIARGLLYLHQDSRLRIIHRDLKTSNILLDEEMNPKISDFGLARIIEGKRIEASTNKVVGTFGYMSPEYALDGKFSIKSDVFSFGVVMLEIISGRKNTGFYDPQEVMNLLGYAWRLWSEDKALDMVDPRLKESCEKSQVMTCTKVGLLCVQVDPNDRPSMSTVVTMLASESTALPNPTQPAFVLRRRISVASSSSSTKPDTISSNELTISMVQGR
ncbi:Serine/threonine protein kinase [Handroanthus impetiginosus]|uniref:Receptor-like serine/threonine-protein kinase n=1 Tax=Handroanthus impetiginosus TaxID=429701 RepID=A0A2G9GT09_9LAMI|nr:Serine/threonine protein kinase [Handroanthus impetiginosus]